MQRFLWIDDCDTWLFYEGYVLFLIKEKSKRKLRLDSACKSVSKKDNEIFLLFSLDSDILILLLYFKFLQFYKNLIYSCKTMYIVKN